ncbi:MAG: hypothetical protein IPK60_23190 [Sandaracinaceae bacterium]|jgi:hypothetical protein|nr:hypothetical protein [Sandaracinaceae bacterium]
MRFAFRVLAGFCLLADAGCSSPEAYPGLMPADASFRDATWYDSGQRDAAPFDASERDAGSALDAHFDIDAPATDARTDARITDTGIDARDSASPVDFGFDAADAGGAFCTGTTGDASAIGRSCSISDACPTGYECVSSAASTTCQIPCALECGGLDCPFGTFCLGAASGEPRTFCAS